MNNQFIHTECEVRAAMHKMGIVKEQSLQIVNSLRLTFEARAINRHYPIEIAAELLWVWATGVARSAEKTYKEVHK